MKFIKQIIFALVSIFLYLSSFAVPAIHVWETQELTFNAKNAYNNPYTDVTVWVDLSGPGFKKRVYGFWDGGKVFHLRLIATSPGLWNWKSGSSSNDAGNTGSFTAINCTDDEKNENPLRHSFLRPLANRHALNDADGTPYFAIGDTWYQKPATKIAFHFIFANVQKAYSAMLSAT